MIPLASIMSIWLFAMTFLCFPSRKIEIANNHNHNNVVDRGLFIISAILLIVFISSTELGLEIYFSTDYFFSHINNSQKHILEMRLGSDSSFRCHFC